MPPDPHRDRPVSRRDLLRTAGTALAAGAGATAGCLATLPPLGQRIRFGRVDTPPGGDASYRDWIPPRSALEDRYKDEVDPLSNALYTEPGRLPTEGEVGTPRLASSIMRSALDYLGVGFENYDWALSVGEGIVLRGDIDTATVDETLTGTVYDPAGSYREFELYRRPARGRDSQRLAAVSETHVVYGTGKYAEGNVRTLIETGLGQERSYFEQADDAERVIDTVGSRPFVWFGTEFVSGMNDVDLPYPTRRATSATHDENAVYFLSYGLYPAGDVPSRAQVQQALEGQNRPTRSSGVEINFDNRLLTVEMRVPHEDLNGGTAFVTPQVTWQGEPDRSTGTFKLTHVAGDRIDAETITVTVDDEDADAQFADEYVTVGPSDSLTVGLPENANDIRVSKSSPDSQNMVVIYDYSFVEGQSGPTPTASPEEESPTTNTDT